MGSSRAEVKAAAPAFIHRAPLHRACPRAGDEPLTAHHARAPILRPGENRIESHFYTALP